jgi:predicted transcriptional regulator
MPCEGGIAKGERPTDSGSTWPELEAKLTRLAAETGRTAAQVALDLLASSIDHDEWFRAEVEKGRAAAREGRLLEHDDVAARMGSAISLGRAQR